MSALLTNCPEPLETAVSTPAKSKEKTYFVSATPRDETSRSTLQLLASGFGQSQLAALLQFDVEPIPSSIIPLTKETPSKHPD